jgi:hypothetical protein
MNMSITAVIAVAALLTGATMMNQYHAEVGAAMETGIAAAPGDVPRRGVRSESGSLKPAASPEAANGLRRGDRSQLPVLTRNSIRTSVDVPRRGTREFDKG